MALPIGYIEIVSYNWSASHTGFRGACCTQKRPPVGVFGKQQADWRAMRRGLVSRKQICYSDRRSGANPG